MRNLYWKIFLSFWLATSLIILIDPIPWAALTARLVIAVFFSGLVCYLLSIYLTRPLRYLKLAAKSLATGQLKTRVGRLIGHHKDEIAELSDEFNLMAEHLEMLITSKQRLIQDVSHELRSPLARLQIAIALGRMKTGTAAIQEFDRMEAECQRLNTLIGEVLEFARLDQSTETLDKTWIDLSELLKELANDANYEFSKSTPRVTLEPMKPYKVAVDARLIHRAIENILRNALRYSPTDKGVLIALYTLPEHPDTVYIDIKDKGPGVPEDQLLTIFNPFYRVDTAREKKTGGYGLGLAIAKQAIERHEGRIIAMNQKDGGLLVRLSLPYHPTRAIS